MAAIDAEATGAGGEATATPSTFGASNPFTTTAGPLGFGSLLRPASQRRGRLGATGQAYSASARTVLTPTASTGPIRRLMALGGEAGLRRLGRTSAIRTDEVTSSAA